LDAELAARLSPEVIERAVAEVPDEFLAPLGSSRSAYVEYLLNRLEAPRPFLEPVLVQGSPRPVRARPGWLDRRR
jgi:hypothetical protein